MEFRLKRRESLFEGCQRVACEEIAGVLQELRVCVTAANTAEPIHEIRKHLKKLKALLRLIAPAIGEEAYVREDSTFRRAGRRLSMARDAEVCVRTVELLQKAAPNLAALQTAHEIFVAILEEHGTPSHRALIGIGASLNDAANLIRDWSPQMGDEEALEWGFESLYRRARKGWKRARDEATMEKLHKWRARTKEYWAALKLLRGMEAKWILRQLKEAKELGEALGSDHDLAVLKDLLTGEESPVELERSAILEVEHLIETQRSMFQRRAWELGEQLFEKKPRRMTEQAVECWREWNDFASST